MNRSRRTVRAEVSEPLKTLDPNLVEENWLGSPYSDEADGRGRFFFTADRWRAHKNSSRYMRHMNRLFRSRTFQAIRAPLGWIALTSSLYTGYQELATHQMSSLPSIEIGNIPFEQSSVALSLLLVFRTDASYGRWNESLTLWGNLRTSAKELVTLASIYVRDPTQLQLIVDWTLAFATCMDIFLKPRASDKAGRKEIIITSLSPLIGRSEAERVASTLPAGHPPTWLPLQVLVQLVHNARLSDVNEGRLLAPLSTLMQLCGSCEKLLRFPIPLSWTRHTSRFLLLWLFLLPLCLYDDLKLATPLADIIIAYLLLGIDEIGVQIEEPFGILPMAQIVNAMRQELADIISGQAAARDVVARAYEPRSETSSSPNITLPISEDS